MAGDRLGDTDLKMGGMAQTEESWLCTQGLFDLFKSSLNPWVHTQPSQSTVKT